jgi:hypothetical protein
METPFAVLSLVASVLEQQGINYVLVGSLASSMHGMYRSTADIDLLADVKAEQVLPLLKTLQDSFYVDENAVREAIARKESFNAIHFDSVFKVDIFIPKGDAFSRKQLERRELRKLHRLGTRWFTSPRWKTPYLQNFAGITLAEEHQIPSGMMLSA